MILCLVSIKLCLCSLVILIHAGAIMNTSEISLPKNVGSWTRPDDPRRVTAQNIFEYMNGAGELYLGYRFDHLDVFVYQSPGREDITVELYHMQTADDAFGLLSLDWGGEPVGPRALYGEGLLRLCAGKLYARIMAERETPESSQAVLDLGRILTDASLEYPEPDLFQDIPPALPASWALRKDRASFIRSHLVLNSQFYLSSENLLDLDLKTEVVTAVYEKVLEPGAAPQRIRWLAVRYADSGAAAKALRHFHSVYLPDFPFPDEVLSMPKRIPAFSSEDGWQGYRLVGQILALVFECPDQATVEAVLADF